MFSASVTIVVFVVADLDACRRSEWLPRRTDQLVWVGRIADPRPADFAIGERRPDKTAGAFEGPIFVDLAVAIVIEAVAALFLFRDSAKARVPSGAIERELSVLTRCLRWIRRRYRADLGLSIRATAIVLVGDATSAKALILATLKYPPVGELAIGVLFAGIKIQIGRWRWGARQEVPTQEQPTDPPHRFH